MAERDKDRKYPFLSPDSERTLRQLERLLKPAFDPANTSWNETRTVIEYTGPWSSQVYKKQRIPMDLTPEFKETLRRKCAVKLVEQLIADSDKQALKIADGIIQKNPLTAK